MMVNSTKKWHVLLTVFALLAALGARDAAADDLARAKRAFKRAEAKFAKGSYRQALELYRQAFALKQLVGFHFNIGQCHRKLGEHKKALEHFRAYLAGSKNPKNQKVARELIRLTEEAIAAEEAAERDRRATAPPPARTPATTPPDKTPAEKGGTRLRPIIFWSGVGLTAAMAITMAITGGMALSKSSDYKAKLEDPAVPPAELDDLRSSGRALKTTSNVFLGLALGTAIGTALYYVSGYWTDETAVTAAPLPGGTTVVVRTGF